MQSIAKPPFAFVSNTLCIVNIYDVYPHLENEKSTRAKNKEEKKKLFSNKFLMQPMEIGNFKHFSEEL